MVNTAFLFPGQGSQKPGMVRELFHELTPPEQAAFEAAFPGISHAVDSEEKGDTDAMAAQLVYLSGLLSARLLEESGILPDVLAGFSLGEITALAFSGVLEPAAADELLALRTRAMDEACLDHPGAMAAVNGLDAAVIEGILAEIPSAWAVNYNSPKQTVISGDPAAIAAASAALKGAGAKLIPLNVKGAFHTPFMQRAADRLTARLAETAFREFRYPVMSNLDAALYPADPPGIRERVARQVISPVQFTAMARALYDQGVRVFIEVGFGKTLQGLISRTLPGADLIITGLSDRAGLASVKEKLEGHPHV